MNIKTLSFSVLILAVLSASVAWLNRSVAPVDPDPRIGQSLLGDFPINTSDTLSLLGDDGHEVALHRDQDQTWRVRSYYNFPADTAKLRRLIQELADAKLARVVTRTPERAARLDLGQTTVTLSSPTSSTQIIWGKPAANGGRYLRLDPAPSAPVYLTPNTPHLDQEAKNWAASPLLTLTARDIKKITFSFADASPLTVNRTSPEDPWIADRLPADQQLRISAINAALNQITGLRFTDTAPRDSAEVIAAENHSRQFEFTTFDDENVIVKLGRRPAEATPADDSMETPSSPEPTDIPNPNPPVDSIPAGPAYAFFTGPSSLLPLVNFQSERAFQIAEYIHNGLPENTASLLETRPDAQPTQPAPQPE